MTNEMWKKIRGSGKTPDQILLSVNGDPAHTLTVRWRTDAANFVGYALYRRAGSADVWKRAEARRNAFKTDVDESSFFFADMSGLVPDTEYEYTCGNDEYRSGPYTFKSAGENFDKFSFVCISDVQSGGAEPPADYSFLNEVLHKIFAEHPECAFILTAGDNTNCGQTDIQWTGLLEGFKGIAEHIPVMFCMGNHDDMGFEDYYSMTGKYYSEHAEYFTNQLRFSYPDNGPDNWKTANYHFDYGNAAFFVTGTSGYEYMNEWLKDEADKSRAQWKFAVHHFPVCYAGPELECEDTYPAMKEGMEKCDIVFSGHEHSFARSYPRRNDGLYDRPSQGTIHYNLGSGHRNPPGTKVVNKVWNAKTYPHEEDVAMFSVVDIDAGVCTLTAYLEDGRIADKCIVNKDTDCIEPADLAPRYNKTRLNFKGYDLGICAKHTYPLNINGVWYIPAGTLVRFIGGTDTRAEGRIRVDIYGRFAEFAENSDIMLTSDGQAKMCAPCLRLNEGQLYVPADDFCKTLRMHYTYFEHNNFFCIESDNEHICVPEQP